MSLTVHLASIPRRSVANRPAAQQPATPATTESSWAVLALKRTGKAVIILAGVVLLLSAITAFKVWMWWPQGHY